MSYHFNYYPEYQEDVPIKDWKELTDLTRGARILVERVLLPDSGIAIEGEFEPPVLARLSAEDQVFVIAFVQVHGSIKEMERIFGISYPTVKNRLNRISGQLQLVETVRRTGKPAGTESDPESSAVLDSLESGEIDVEEAVRRLSG
ncbi:MAG: DUF2089 domain-containing protein [Gemmatimonadetes bacterium]|nr:DUF2089 domain-containing protein [Gemmatimonadota bacterium]